MQRLSILLLLSLSCVARAAILGGPDAEKLKPAPLPDGARFQTGPDKDLQRLAISPDGKTIAVASEAGAVVFWDAGTGKAISTIAAHDKCYCVDFTLDGKAVVTCGGDKLVKLWDVASGKMIKQFAGHTEEVKYVACCPDGKRIASCEGATANPTIRIWDIESGHELKTMTGHGDDVEVTEGNKCEIDILGWSPDGRKLITEASDVTARLWDVVGGRQIRILPQHDNSVAAVAISPDNSMGASTRHPDFNRQMYDDPNIPYTPRPSEVRIWKMSGADLSYELAAPNNVPRGITVQRIITGFDGDATCVAFAPDSRSIVVGSFDEAGQLASVRQWDIATGVEIRRFKFSSKPMHVAFFPDGSAAGVVSPREGLTVIKLNDVLPGADAAPCSSVDDAWNKLDSPEYGVRATAFQFIVKGIAPEALTAELLRRTEAASADAGQTKKIEEAIAGLDSANYSVRMNSMEALHDFAGAARAALVEALKSPSNEVRIRAAELLHDIGGAYSPRGVLVIEMLKTVGRPEAQAAIEKLRKK